MFAPFFACSAFGTLAGNAERPCEALGYQEFGQVVAGACRDEAIDSLIAGVATGIGKCSVDGERFAELIFCFRFAVDAQGMGRLHGRDSKPAFLVTKPASIGVAAFDRAFQAINSVKANGAHGPIWKPNWETVTIGPSFVDELAIGKAFEIRICEAGNDV